MTIREYTKCTICNKKYIIRYGLSDQFPQRSSFFCKKCGETLAFGYDKKRSVTLENLELIEADESGTIINLHPELIVDRDSLDDPYHFATLDFMFKQLKGNDKLGIRMKEIQYSVINYNKVWELIDTDFRLLSEKKYDLLEEKYGKNKTQIEKKIIKKVLEATKIFFIGKWEKIYNDVNSEFHKAKTKTKYQQLKSFLVLNKDKYIDALYSVMSEYYSYRSELLITLISQKCEHIIDGNSSMVDWKRIEKIYGDFFEIYGDLLSIITATNNLLVRDNHELFTSEGFTLSQYMNSDKANRCNNFIGNSKFQALSEYYDSGIRNGTHHKNSKIDKENNEIILGVGKGGTTDRRISLTTYIFHCNEIYARILIILNIALRNIVNN